MKYLCRNLLLSSFWLQVITSFNVLASSSANNEQPIVPASTSDSLFPVLTGLITVLMVIFVLAFLIKRLNLFQMKAQSIKVIECLALSPKEKLIVIDIQQRQFLLGVTAQQINTLCELNEPVNAQSKVEDENRNKETVSSFASADKNRFQSILMHLLKPSAKKSELLENASRDKNMSSDVNVSNDRSAKTSIKSNSMLLGD